MGLSCWGKLAVTQLRLEQLVFVFVVVIGALNIIGIGKEGSAAKKTANHGHKLWGVLRNG